MFRTRACPTTNTAGERVDFNPRIGLKRSFKKAVVTFNAIGAVTTSSMQHAPDHRAQRWRVRARFVGVGKTHLAEALGHQACCQGHRVLFTKTSRLLSDLGGGHPDGTWDARLRAYLQPALLVIDDWAMREFTTQQADDLYELISERTRAGSMILTSNRAPQDWYALFPNPVLAESALDRLLGRAQHLVLQGRSYRPLQRPDRAARALAEPLPASEEESGDRQT